MNRRDAGPSQRGLVGRRIRFEDRELLTKYVFPFVGRPWTVAFMVLDVSGTGPRVYEGPLEVRADALAADGKTEALKPMESIPLERFQGLVHFDPWWAFRGAAGVPRAWSEAIVATNIAGTFEHEGRRYKVHDFLFGAGLRDLRALVAKDDAFRPISLERGYVDLLALRRDAKR